MHLRICVLYKKLLVVTVSLLVFFFSFESSFINYYYYFFYRKKDRISYNSLNCDGSSNEKTFVLFSYFPNSRYGIQEKRATWKMI